MDQRDSHCPYSLSSEITAKPTVLGFSTCVSLCHSIYICCARIHYYVHTQSLHIVPRVKSTRSTNNELPLQLNSQFKSYVRTTAGQEDPFELDSNLLLSSGRHGEDRKRQYIHLYDHETPLLDDLADLLY